VSGDLRMRVRVRAPLGLSVQYGLLWCLWTSLSGGSPHDLWLGLVAAGLGVLGFALVRAAMGVSYRFRWRWIGQGVRVPGEVASNTGLALSTLAARLFRGQKAASVMREVRFDDRGGPAELVGRQALAVVYGTTSPNFIAVGFEGEHEQAGDGLKLVYHQLRATPISESLRRLGAMP
jgi:hypothetical protein